MPALRRLLQAGGGHVQHPDRGHSGISFSATTPNSNPQTLDPCCRLVEFTFSTQTGNAGGVSFECRLVPGGQSDAGPAFRPCSSPASYSQLADGAWQFFVRAVGEGIADSSSFVKVGRQ